MEENLLQFLFCNAAVIKDHRISATVINDSQNSVNEVILLASEIGSDLTGDALQRSSSRVILRDILCCSVFNNFDKSALVKKLTDEISFMRDVLPLLNLRSKLGVLLCYFFSSDKNIKTIQGSLRFVGMDLLSCNNYERFDLDSAYRDICELETLIGRTTIENKSVSDQIVNLKELFRRRLLEQSNHHVTVCSELLQSLPFIISERVSHNTPQESIMTLDPSIFATDIPQNDSSKLYLTELHESFFTTKTNCGRPCRISDYIQFVFKYITTSHSDNHNNIHKPSLKTHLKGLASTEYWREINNICLRIATLIKDSIVDYGLASDTDPDQPIEGPDMSRSSNRESDVRDTVLDVIYTLNDLLRAYVYSTSSSTLTTTTITSPMNNNNHPLNQPHTSSNTHTNQSEIGPTNSSLKGPFNRSCVSDYEPLHLFSLIISISTTFLTSIDSLGEPLQFDILEVLSHTLGILTVLPIDALIREVFLKSLSTHILIPFILTLNNNNNLPTFQSIFLSSLQFIILNSNQCRDIFKGHLATSEHMEYLLHSEYDTWTTPRCLHKILFNLDCHPKLWLPVIILQRYLLQSMKEGKIHTQVTLRKLLSGSTSTSCQFGEVPGVARAVLLGSLAWYFFDVEDILGNGAKEATWVVSQQHRETLLLVLSVLQESDPSLLILLLDDCVQTVKTSWICDKLVFTMRDLRGDAASPFVCAMLMLTALGHRKSLDQVKRWYGGLFDRDPASAVRVMHISVSLVLSPSLKSFLTHPMVAELQSVATEISKNGRQQHSNNGSSSLFNFRSRAVNILGALSKGIEISLNSWSHEQPVITSSYLTTSNDRLRGESREISGVSNSEISRIEEEVIDVWSKVMDRRVLPGDVSSLTHLVDTIRSFCSQQPGLEAMAVNRLACSQKILKISLLVASLIARGDPDPLQYFRSGGASKSTRTTLYSARDNPSITTNEKKTNVIIFMSSPFEGKLKNLLHYREELIEAIGFEAIEISPLRLRLLLNSSDSSSLNPDIHPNYVSLTFDLIHIIYAHLAILGNGLNLHGLTKKCLDVDSKLIEVIKENRDKIVIPLVISCFQFYLQEFLSYERDEQRGYITSLYLFTCLSMFLCLQDEDLVDILAEIYDYKIYLSCFKFICQISRTRKVLTKKKILSHILFRSLGCLERSSLLLHEKRLPVTKLLRLLPLLSLVQLSRMFSVVADIDYAASGNPVSNMGMYDTEIVRPHPDREILDLLTEGILLEGNTCTSSPLIPFPSLQNKTVSNLTEVTELDFILRLYTKDVSYNSRALPSIPSKSSVFYKVKIIYHSGLHGCAIETKLSHEVTYESQSKRAVHSDDYTVDNVHEDIDQLCSGGVFPSFELFWRVITSFQDDYKGNNSTNLILQPFCDSVSIPALASKEPILETHMIRMHRDVYLKAEYRGNRNALAADILVFIYNLYLRNNSNRNKVDEWTKLLSHKLHIALSIISYLSSSTGVLNRATDAQTITTIDCSPPLSVYIIEKVKKNDGAQDENTKQYQQNFLMTVLLIIPISSTVIPCYRHHNTRKEITSGASAVSTVELSDDIFKSFEQSLRDLQRSFIVIRRFISDMNLIMKQYHTDEEDEDDTSNEGTCISDDIVCYARALTILISILLKTRDIERSFQESHITFPTFTHRFGLFQKEIKSTLQFFSHRPVGFDFSRDLKDELMEQVEGCCQKLHWDFRKILSIVDLFEWSEDCLKHLGFDLSTVHDNTDAMILGTKKIVDLHESIDIQRLTPSLSKIAVEGHHVSPKRNRDRSQPLPSNESVMMMPSKKPSLFIHKQSFLGNVEIHPLSIEDYHNISWKESSDTSSKDLCTSELSENILSRFKIPF